MEAAGTEALTTLKVLIAPLPLVDCKYKQFKEAIERHVRPKERLLLSERTKFWQLRQQPGEPVDNYLQRIRLAAKQCQFEKLTEKTAAEELCRVQLISGLEDKSMTTRVLNYLETKETSTADELVDFIRRQLDVSEFTQGQGQVKSGQILLTKGKMSNSFRAKSSNPVSFSKTRSKPWRFFLFPPPIALNFLCKKVSPRHLKQNEKTSKIEFLLKLTAGVRSQCPEGLMKKHLSDDVYT